MVHIERLERIVQYMKSGVRTPEICKRESVTPKKLYRHIDEAVHLALVSPQERSAYANSMRISSFNRTKENAEKVAQQIQKERTPEEIRKDLGLGVKKFWKLANDSVKLGYLDNSEYVFYKRLRRISKGDALINKSLLKEIVGHLRDGKPNNYIRDKYSIRSNSTLRYAIKNARALGIIDDDEYIKFSKGLRRFVDYIRSENPEYYKNVGIRISGDNLERFRRAGSIGGQRNWQKNQAETLKRLDKTRVVYTTGKYFYEDIMYDSKGERFLAVFLQEAGIIPILQNGISVHKKIGESEADFYVSPDLIIEYHPIPKQRSVANHNNIDEYAAERQAKFKDYFTGKIVCLESVKKVELFQTLSQNGIINLNWQEYSKMYYTISGKIKKDEESLSFDFKLPERTPIEEEVPF